MNKPVIIVEMPKLRNETVMGIYDFWQEITLAFESRYLHQLRRYHRNASREQVFNPFTEE